MSMLTFAQLVENSCLRTLVFEIEGRGQVTLTELSAKEAEECDAKDLKGEPLESHIVHWAARMLKGSTPTEQECTALRTNLSADVIQRIYIAGLRFELQQKEDAEKN